MSTKPTSPSIYAKGKKVYPEQGRRVFVGLSGGVDSAVSAALLKQQGYDVTGVFIRAWQPEWLPCTWREERRDAMKVCLALDIPFLFLDAEAEYKQGVVDRMLEEYKKNRTPNPDVLCNREIKFGIFWQFAKERGADFIATGHYARIEREFPISNSQFSINESISNEHSNIENSLKIGNLKLKIGLDSEKDQSYFLWTLTQEDLSHTLFPVGNMEKREVRELAQKFGLPVAEKKDSQGICFMGSVSMEDFLSHYIEAKPGKVVNAEGEVIGSHKGLVYYTVGERHGFTIDKKGASAGPFYVVAKDAKKNLLVVSDQQAEIEDFSPTKVIIDKANWITVPEHGALTARIRYRGEKLPCTLKLEGKKLAVEFEKPVPGLSLGQSIVFYEGEICLGGAVMDKIVA
jgi:tRNA-specific 2-thiouridylase